MSDKSNRSAVDAIVEQNMALRDEVDDLTDERDAAVQKANELSTSKEEWARNARPAPNVGYADNGDGGNDRNMLGDAEVEGDTERDLDSVIAERDSYLADSQRLAADFANYRKQSDKRVVEAAAAQSASLVRNLLPVLDACDSALELDAESPVAPIRAALLGELERSGLELLSPAIGDPFDPELHEAVMHEVDDDDAVGDDGEPLAARVSEVFRAGYVWKGRVVRPAMVKVIG